MRVLVTGGAGFIGSHIVGHFQGRAEVVVLDNLRSGSRENLRDLSCEFVEGSVTDRDAVKCAVDGVDYVFHLAAMVSVPESMNKPIECVELNTTGTLILLEEARRAKVRKLCFSSSAAIYGENPASPKVETMTVDPRSPYAVTKFDGECYCLMFQREGWLETACLRYFNVFGPRQDPRGPYAAAVPIFAGRALKGEPLTIFGDGEQTRDFIYVKDVVLANVHFATTPGLTGVCNVAHGQGMTINGLARRIKELTRSNSPIRHEPRREGDLTHSIASTEKLRSAGYVPQTTVEQGLKSTIESLATGRSGDLEFAC
jgi:UDP-glucose 4-epimerase